MTEILKAALVLFVLLGSSALGRVVYPLLSERHRSREVIDFVRLDTAMLVTFAALVLGLLTTSVKASYDKVGSDLSSLSISLIQLDQCLREWGEDAVPFRKRLRAYTAAALATTWTEEPRPPGNYYPKEAPTIHCSEVEGAVRDDILTRVEFGIQLEPHDPMHSRLETTCIANTSG
jgi:hypothetical protein